MHTSNADHNELAHRQVEVRRSRRRRRTVSAFREGDKFVVLVPARMSNAQVAEYVDELVGRLVRRERRTSKTDADLHARAIALSQRWLPTAPVPKSVRWVTNQQQRWGSCTPADGTIRLSHRMQRMPDYVIDYVLLHELAHLLIAGHGSDFDQLMSVYPKLAQAQAFLDGASFAAANRLSDAPSEPAPAQPEPAAQSTPIQPATPIQPVAIEPPIGTLF